MRIKLQKDFENISEYHINFKSTFKYTFFGFSEIPTSVKYLHVNCTSNGLGKRPKVPVFNDKKIYLQSIIECQQVASASMIGALEGRYSGNDEVIF